MCRFGHQFIRLYRFLGQPSERVGDFTDVELCTELADKTFKYHSGWQWAISDEIKKENLIHHRDVKRLITLGIRD